MNFQAELKTLLGSLVTGGVWANVVSGVAVTPYITWSRITAIEQTTLDTNGGTGNASNTRLQIDVWALTYAEAQTKAAAVKAALKGWAVENILLDEQDMHEPDTGLHRVMLDLSTWHL
ncbi:MAG: DUF3168 domain-containing protein [Polaromonas sp.]|nr:DUF3168 domain-containing protein [Polaromonas sp.]